MAERKAFAILSGAKVNPENLHQCTINCVTIVNYASQRAACLWEGDLNESVRSGAVLQRRCALLSHFRRSDGLVAISRGIRSFAAKRAARAGHTFKQGRPAGGRAHGAAGG